jgi:hypothetical protein
MTRTRACGTRPIFSNLPHEREAGLLREIEDLGQGIGAIVLRLNSGQIRGVRLCPAGTPDLLLLHRGQMLFIECKARDGRLAASQVQMHARLRGMGFPVIVARTLDEVLKQLEHCDG